MQVQLVGSFTVSATGYCYFSQEINRFSKPFQVVNIKNAGFLKLETQFFHFCPVTQRSFIALYDKTKVAVRDT